MSENYTTIKLPKDFVELIDELVESKLGFSSRTEVVKTAIREYYEKQIELDSIDGSGIKKKQEREDSALK